MRKKMFVGVDVGGTKISAGLLNAQGRVLYYAKEATPKGASPRRLLSVIIGAIGKALDAKGVKKSELGGVGLGIPGIVGPQHRILKAPNVHLAGFPLAVELKKKMRVPIAMGNDVNCGLLGEQWRGAARGIKDVVGIFPGTGVGGAVIIKGQLYQGIHGAAGELGHMTMDINGPLCHCGNHGCLEALVSRWAIERDIRAAVRSGRKTVITRLVNGNLGTIKSRFLKEALKVKDPVVTAIMKNVSVVLGKACVSVNHIFNPQQIVLGGGVINACGSFVLPIVKKTVAKDPFFTRINTCRVVQSTLGDEAVIMGAVRLLGIK